MFITKSPSSKPPKYICLPQLLLVLFFSNVKLEGKDQLIEKF